jgi:hypothetical protein
MTTIVIGVFIALLYTLANPASGDVSHSRHKRQGAGQLFLNVITGLTAPNTNANFSIPINVSDPNAVRPTPAPPAPPAGARFQTSSVCSSILD